TTLQVEYDIVGGAAPTFDIGFYRSADAVYGSDTFVSSITLTGTDLDPGHHSKTFTIGSGSGQVPLPGAGAADVNTDYYLLAVADPTNAVSEDDADPFAEDNTAAFAGAYHLPGGDVLVHGSDAADYFTLAGDATPATIFQDDF